MKINFEGGHIVIDDNDERAKKIRQGFKYSFDEDHKLVISNEKVFPDFEVLLPKLGQKTCNLQEINQILYFLVNKSLEKW